MEKRRKGGLVCGLLVVAGLSWMGVIAVQGAESVDKPEAPAKKDSTVFLRDPFWPVGHDPRPTVLPTGVDEVSAEEELRKTIRGVGTLGSGNFVMIAGGNKSVGDVVSFVYSGKTYKWRITKIAAPKEIELQFLSAE